MHICNILNCELLLVAVGSVYELLSIPCNLSLSLCVHARQKIFAVTSLTLHSRFCIYLCGHGVPYSDNWNEMYKFFSFHTRVGRSEISNLPRQSCVWCASSFTDFLWLFLKFTYRISKLGNQKWRKLKDKRWRLERNVSMLQRPTRRIDKTSVIFFVYIFCIALTLKKKNIL